MPLRAINDGGDGSWNTGPGGTGVTFRHSNEQVGDLYLRLPPTSVEWTYNLNTNVVNTYGGQVVQLLSMNFDKLTIQGQFGTEGAWGKIIDKTTGQPRTRRTSELYDLNKGRGKNPAAPVGLAQMTAYFSRYFALASQGSERTEAGNLLRGHYDQDPMEIYYQTDLENVMRRWLVYPTSFPSYSRSNDNFAPEWQLVCEVEEPDQTIPKQGLPAALKRLRAAVGYKAFSRFSDPLGAFLYDANGNLISTQKALNFAKSEVEKQNNLIFDDFGNLLPSMNEQDLNELVQFGASMPKVVLNSGFPIEKPASVTPTAKKKK